MKYSVAYYFLPIFFLFNNVSHANELIERSVLNDTVLVSLPTAFSVMSPKLKNFKYPNDKINGLVYTDDTTKVNIILGISSLKINNLPPERELDDLQKEILIKWRTLNPTCERLIIHSLSTLRCEFVSQAIDTKIHNIVQYTLNDKNTVIANFNVTEDLASEWLETGKAILGSIKFAENSTK